MNSAFLEIVAAGDDDRRALFLSAARRLGTAVQNVEKDFSVYNHQGSVHHALGTSLYLVRSGRQYVATDTLGRAGERNGTSPDRAPLESV